MPEYFNASLVGLTATPSDRTFGFLNQNLVMQYNHEQAVADGVNLDFDICRIRTQITERGAMVEARDQIRTVIRIFWEKHCSEIFPGRTEVPKTRIFAKGDSHADDIIEIVREEFGKGDEFAR